MSIVHPLFVCCCHAKISFAPFRQTDKRCCWHTMGFKEKRVFDKEDKLAAIEFAVHFKKLHAVKEAS